MIQLNLTIEEVNAILTVLGQIPTNSGVYPLLMKIKEQGEAQVPPEPLTSPVVPMVVED